MKRTAIILVALTLSTSWGAKAQQLDLSTMTCDSFIKSDKDQMKLITAWFLRTRDPFPHRECG